MSTTFSVSRDDCIKAALRLLGHLAEGETPSSEDLTNGAQALNILFKTWADKGYKAFCYRNYSFAFVAAKVSWTVGPAGDVNVDRPQRIADAWWQDSNGLRSPLKPLERERFYRLSPATQQGTPVNYYYDAQLSLGVFYPWPIPLDTNGTFYISVQRPIDDISAGGDPVLLPQTWFRAVKWCLADELGLEYRPHPDVLDRIDKKAERYIMEAADLEEEQGSIYLQPASNGGYEAPR